MSDENHCDVCETEIPPDIFVDPARYLCEICSRMFGPCCNSVQSGRCVDCCTEVDDAGQLEP